MKILNYQTNYSVYNTNKNNNVQNRSSQTPALLTEPQKTQTSTFTGLASWWKKIDQKIAKSNREDTLNRFLSVIKENCFADSDAISVLMHVDSFNFKPPTKFCLDKVVEISKDKEHWSMERMQELLRKWEEKKYIKKADNEYIMQVSEDLEFSEILKKFEADQKRQAKK